MVSPSASAFFSGGKGGALPLAHSSVGSTAAAAAAAAPFASAATSAIARPHVPTFGGGGLSPLRRRATLLRSLRRRSVPSQVLRCFISRRFFKIKSLACFCFFFFCIEKKLHVLLD